jgi:hypothetical protein
VTRSATQNDRPRASVSELQSLAPDGRTCPSPHRRQPSRPGRLGAPGPGRPPVGQVGPLSARPSGEPAAPPGRRPEAGSGAPHLPHRPGWRQDRNGPSSTSSTSRPRHRAEPGRGPHHAPGHRRRSTRVVPGSRASRSPGTNPRGRQRSAGSSEAARCASPQEFVRQVEADHPPATSDGFSLMG